MNHPQSIKERIKNIIIGAARNPKDRRIFHKISLIALFAWVGLGADGLSSSCYGPQEIFLALKTHPYLSILLAIATTITIFIITTSYSQIVELFPAGGGGYLVASKLLSPTVGMISGCALIIDYVLTIAVSIASGVDAIFSLLPLKWHTYKVACAVCILLVLMVLNMRGVKESIVILMPIFLAFILTHIFIIIYALFQHIPFIPQVIVSVKVDLNNAISEMGFLGMLFLLLHAYTMGAGTYTGLEAVSNTCPILREPKAETAKKTMRYMAISLSFMVIGLILGCVLYNVHPMPGKTLNAILFEQITQSWEFNMRYTFIIIALLTEATLLFVAAQAGFIDGPRVLANMALDQWIPTRFSVLSDRLVIQNGILILTGSALALIVLTHGSVHFLVILYSINVFITFCLSQIGMVRHWWNSRSQVKNWGHKLAVNGIGLMLTFSILITMVIFKFNEGGWITLVITGGLVGLCLLINKHYRNIRFLLRKLNLLVEAVEAKKEVFLSTNGQVPVFNPTAKTAVLAVTGFNGIGLHTLLGILRLFPGVFKNFIFVRVGIVDAGNFKGIAEVKNLEQQIKSDIEKYVAFMRKEGYYAEGISKIGTDVVDEISEIASQILERFPEAVFFGGQLIFPSNSLASKILHNYTAFTLQERLYYQGISFIILPIRV